MVFSMGDFRKTHFDGENSTFFRDSRTERVAPCHAYGGISTPDTRNGKRKQKTKPPKRDGSVKY